MLIAEIRSVDFAPPDLYAQVPFAARLVRQLPGKDRPDYWLALLERPLMYAAGARQHTINWIVVAPRWKGQVMGPSAGPVALALGYVLNETQVTEPALDISKCTYVAVASATIAELEPGSPLERQGAGVTAMRVAGASHTFELPDEAPPAGMRGMFACIRRWFES
jgi:hypothetical protein